MSEFKFKESDWESVSRNAYELTLTIYTESKVATFNALKDGKIVFGNFRIVYVKQHGNVYEYKVLLVSDVPFDGTVKVHDRQTSKSQPWTKEVVFKTYCNDNLYELPLGILEQMRDYLNNIIDNKKEIE